MLIFIIIIIVKFGFFISLFFFLFLYLFFFLHLYCIHFKPVDHFKQYNPFSEMPLIHKLRQCCCPLQLCKCHCHQNQSSRSQNVHLASQCRVASSNHFSTWSQARLHLFSPISAKYFSVISVMSLNLIMMMMS